MTPARARPNVDLQLQKLQTAKRTLWLFPQTRTFLL